MQEHGIYTLNKIADFSHEKQDRGHSSISKGLSDKFKSYDEEEFSVNADLKKKRASYWSDLVAAVSGWDQRMPGKESSLQVILQVNGLEIYT